jgi:RNA polymerase sigma-70 factor (ECF subfamily)
MLVDGISDLPDELAQVVMLRDLDGLDYREIGDFLGLPDGTVKSRLNRARIELAKIVRKRIGETGGRKGSVFGSFSAAPAAGAGGLS